MHRMVPFLCFFLSLSILHPIAFSGARENPRGFLKNLTGIERNRALGEYRARFRNQQRSYPFNSYPPGKKLEAIVEVRNMKLAVYMNEQPRWEPIGPGNIGGRLNAVAVDPMDDDIIYVGGVSSGVWKTTNGGSSWTPLTDHLPSLSIGALAIDPLDPDVIYAGTGEENFINQYGCKPYRSDQYPGAGVFKSTDGGDTWTRAGEFFSESMCRIAIHPTGTDTLLVASVDGIYKSTDGGDTWVLSREGIGTDVLIDPGTPSVVYCAIGKPDGDTSNGIYKSTDTGETWVRETTGLPDPQQHGRVMLAMALSSTGHQTIFANISFIDTPLGIYKTTDGGGTWSHTGSSDVGDCYKNATIVDPLDELTCYTGGLELYKTTDGGNIWTVLTSWWEDIYPYDNQLMTWGNDLATLFNVSDRGIFKSTDGGFNWIDLDNELEVTEIQSVALHPTERSIGLAGCQDRGTLIYTGEAQGWRQIYLADAGVTAFDYVVPTTIFTEYVYLSLMKSTDLGENWDYVDDGIDYYDDVGFYAPYVLDPNNHLKMYAGTDRVYKSTDGAGHWVPISSDLTKDLGFYTSFLSTIAVSETDSMVIYVGTSDGNFRASTDGGNSWVPADSGLPNRFVMDIAIDPTDAAHVYTVFSGYDTTHVWESSDYGTTWDDISSNLPDVPVNTIVLPTGRFAAPGTIYIGTDFSCFKTTDNGTSWFPFNNGLPNTVVEDMAFHEELGFIRAGTQGRSIFEVVDTTGTAGITEDDSPLPVAFSLEQNYPNPFNPETTISYSLSTDGYVTLSVFDLKGRKISTIFEGRQGKGNYRRHFDGKGLPSGVYFYRLDVRDWRGNTLGWTRKFLLLK